MAVYLGKQFKYHGLNEKIESNLPICEAKCLKTKFFQTTWKPVDLAVIELSCFLMEGQNSTTKCHYSWGSLRNVILNQGLQNFN